MLSPSSTPVLTKLPNHYTQSPLRKILSFLKCCQLSNFYSPSPCQAHRKWTLKKVTPRNDLSPLFSKAQRVAPLYKCFTSCPTRVICVGVALPSGSWAPARKDHQFKLLSRSSGPCSQLPKWNGKMYPSLHWLGKHSLFWCWRLSVPGIQSQLQKLFFHVDALQIAQASVWLFLNFANHEGSLHIYFKKFHS